MAPALNGGFPLPPMVTSWPWFPLHLLAEPPAPREAWVLVGRRPPNLKAILASRTSWPQLRTLTLLVFCVHDVSTG